MGKSDFLYNHSDKGKARASRYRNSNRGKATAAANNRRTRGDYGAWWAETIKVKKVHKPLRVK